MSLRDEIAKTLADPDAEDWSWNGMADALMPLVERAVREAFRAGVNVGSSPRFDGHTPRESVDAIVTRVLGAE